MFAFKEVLMGQDGRRLLHHLFVENGYNKFERPVKNEADAINVTFGLVLQQIIDVDEKNQILHSNIWLNMKWIDVNLHWNPDEFGGISTLQIPAKEVWKPDILLYNSADQAFDGTFHTNVIMEHTGHMTWVPPGMFHSTCQIDIKWFPFDEQHCKLKFGSWTYDGRFLNLLTQESEGDTSDFIRNGEWELIGMPATRNVDTYECCPQFYIDITYTVHVKRRTLYYGFNIIIPCVLISLMSLLLFMLPPDSGEKISLGVTILLSLMVFLLLVAETVPPTSDAVPLIGIYFCCIMIMCSLSVMFTVIVLNFHYRGPETYRMPDWIRRYINGWLAWCLHMKRPGRDMKEFRKGSSSSLTSSLRLRDAMLQERQSRILLTNFVEADEEMRVENGAYVRRVTAPREENPYLSPKSDLSAILREIRKITAKCKREDDDLELRGEWRFAAMVLDRLCLWICVTLTVLSTTAIMSSAPTLSS